MFHDEFDSFREQKDYIKNILESCLWLSMLLLLTKNNTQHDSLNIFSINITENVSFLCVLVAFLFS